MHLRGSLLHEKQGTPYIIIPKTTNIYFGDLKDGDEQKNISFESPNTKWYTELVVTTENIKQQHSIDKCMLKKPNSRIMQISQLTRHSHHTIGAIFDSSSCLS